MCFQYNTHRVEATEAGNRISSTAYTTNQTLLQVQRRIQFIHDTEYHWLVGWLRSTVVERRSFAGELLYPALELQLSGDHVRCRSTN